MLKSKRLLKRPVNRLGFLFLISGVGVGAWSFLAWLNQTHGAMFRIGHDYDVEVADIGEEVSEVRWHIEPKCVEPLYERGLLQIEAQVRAHEATKPNDADLLTPDFFASSREWNTRHSTLRERLAALQNKGRNPCQTSSTSLCLNSVGGFVREGLSTNQAVRMYGEELARRDSWKALGDAAYALGIRPVEDGWRPLSSLEEPPVVSEALREVFFEALPPELRVEAAQACLHEANLRRVIVRSYPLASLNDWLEQDGATLTIAGWLIGFGGVAAFLSGIVVWIAQTGLWLCHNTIGRLYKWIRGPGGEGDL